jgi:hypothetical protein
VRGVQTSVDPTTGPYIVEGFWLNNPVWDSSISAHDASDTCGSGGSHGIANEFVTYAEWQTNRFNGCAYDDPTNATQWVSVCDPEPATFELPSQRPFKPRADGRRLILAERVAKLATAGLDDYRLRQSEIGAAALKTGRFGVPRLVQRLDRPGEFYYLTPWERNGRITATVDLDGRFGVLRSLRVLPAPARPWAIGGESATHVREAVGRLLDHRAFDRPDDQGRFKVFPGTYCVPPVLVWKPCRESWSPHLPFYHVVVGGYSLYVRIDGRIFTQLTSGRGV